MADIHTLEAALVNADKAGDAQSARVLAAEIMRLRKTPDAIDQSATDAQKPSGLERFGRGMMDLYQGIKQLGLSAADAISPRDVTTSDLVTGQRGSRAGDYTKSIDEELKMYDKGRGKDAGFDWARLVGGFVTPASAIPGGVGPTLTSRIATGAASGAAQGGLAYTPENESKAAQVVLGGAAGAAGPAIVQGVTGAVRAGVNAVGNQAQRVANILPPEDITIRLQTITNDAGVNWATLGPEIQDGLRAEANRQLQAGGGLNAEALARQARAQSLDPRLELTRGQATRTPQDWQTEQNLRSVQGVGDGLRQRFGQQGQILTENAERLNRGADPYVAGERTVRTLQDKFAETGDDVSGLYGVARETLGAQANVPPGQLQRVGMEVLDRYEGNVPAAVERKLREFGITRMGPVTPTRALTVESAEDLIKTINANWDASNRTKTNALREIKRGLTGALDEVEATGTEAAQRFGQARRAASSRFDEFGQRIASAAVDDVAPDKFVRRFVIGADARDIQALTRSLTTGTPEQVARGTEALTQLRAATISEIFEKNNVLRDGMLSGTNLDKALRQLGPQRMAAIFTPDQVQQLNLLRQVSLDLTRPPALSDINYSRTTSALANLMQSVGKLPVVGNAAAGAAGKITDLIIQGEQRRAVQQALGGSAATARPPVETMTRESQNALARRIAPYQWLRLTHW